MDDSALSEIWCRELRQGWRQELLRATNASQMKQLLNVLEQHVRWGHFDSSPSESEFAEDTASSEVAQRRGPGRPPKRGRALPATKCKRSRNLQSDEVLNDVDLQVAEDTQEAANGPSQQTSTMDVCEVGSEISGKELSSQNIDGRRGAADAEDAVHPWERHDHQQDIVDEFEGLNEEGEDEAKGEEDAEQHKDEKVARRTRHALMQETMMQRALNGNTQPSRRDDDSDDNDEDPAQPATQEEVSTVEGFQQLAANYKGVFYGGMKSGKRTLKPIMLATDIEIASDRVELDFWRLVGGADKAERARDCDVCHSAVVLSSGAGGGFAHRDEPGAEREEPYVSSPWNPHNLPQQAACVISHMADEAPCLVSARPLPRCDCD